MESFDKIAKRFQFDLEIGRFKSFNNEDYLFYSEDKQKLEIFEKFLNSIGYSHSNLLSTKSNEELLLKRNDETVAIIISTTTKRVIGISYIARDITNQDILNDIPDYVYKWREDELMI